ncbi:hypothetical protein EV127DRAFT_517894 [Xylaria flabelliformis]|nr:hypothetical protein EV127DRAFT_517894 [Xylaria flabelliformis]
MTSPAVTPSNVMAPTGSKLRDSCLACSSSKVRCPREKPTCSRCQKRRVNCEYLTSKRAGRKHDTSNDSVVAPGKNTTQYGMLEASPPVENAPAILPTIVAASAPTTTLQSSQHTPSTAHDFFMSSQLFNDNIFSDLMTSPGGFETFTDISSNNQDLDSLLSPLTSIPSTMDSPHADMTLGGLLDFTAELNSTENNNLRHGMECPPELVHADFSAQASVEPPTKPPYMEMSTVAKEPGANDHQMTIESDCNCLLQIMTLMRQLFPRPSLSGIPPTTTENTTLPPSVAAIIDRNRSSMDVVSSALSCSCSDDPHMLAVTAHVVFKILVWYVIAVQSAASPPNEPDDMASGKEVGENGNTTISSATSNIDHSKRKHFSGDMLSPPYSNHEQGHWEAERADHCSSRMAAQLVLGELYLAQRLVTELVSKLKSRPLTNKDVELAGLPLNKVTEPLLLPFSGTVLDLLGNNLRDQLKALSLGIVKRLRDD